MERSPQGTLSRCPARSCLTAESPRRRAVHHQAHHQSRSLRQAVELRAALNVQLDQELQKEKERNAREQTLVAETLEKKVKARADDIIEALKFEQTKLQRQLEGVRARLVDKERRFLDLQTQTEALQLELESVKTVSAAKRCETDPRLILASAEAANVRQENARLIECCREMEELKSAKDAEITTLRLRLSELEVIRLNERRDNECSRREMESLLLSRENDLIELSADLMRQKRTVEQLQAGVEAELEESNSLAQRDKDQLTAKLYQEEQKTAKIDQELQSYIEQVNELEESVRTKEKYIDQYKETILALETELSTQNCAATLEAYEDALHQARAKMAHLIEKITFLEYDNRNCKEIWRENVKLRKTILEMERGLAKYPSIDNLTSTIVPTNEDHSVVASSFSNDGSVVDGDDDFDQDLSPIEQALISLYKCQPVYHHNHHQDDTTNTNTNINKSFQGGVISNEYQLHFQSMSQSPTANLAELCRVSKLSHGKGVKSTTPNKSVIVTIRILNGDLYVDRPDRHLVNLNDWIQSWTTP